MKAKLDFIVPEPEIIDGGRMDLNVDVLKHLLDNSKIDRKFNHYLKDKKVIIVGPASYMLEHNKQDFIDSHDVVVRLNKNWNIEPKYQKHFGTKTNIRYHCGMENEHNGGAWNIPGMLEKNIEYAAISFPKNLSYFHNDILKFEKLNSQHNMNFHYFSDLELYITLHHFLGTRMTVGTVAFTDLLFYDIKSLHISGITFLEDGWYKGYKINPEWDDKKYMSKDLWKLKKDIGNHAMNPQKQLLNLFTQIDNRITLDPEVEESLVI